MAALLQKLRGKRRYSLPADTSRFKLDGKTPALVRSWDNLYAAQGRFQLTGQDSMPRRLRVAFPGVYKLTASAGTFAMAGKPALFTDTAVGDFNARRNAPGVFRSFSFDTADQLGIDATNQDLGTTAATSFGWGAGSGPNATVPSIDLTKGALRLQVPGNTTTDPAGKWITRFFDEVGNLGGGPQVFRTNCSLYIQFAFEHDGYFSSGELGTFNGTAPKWCYLGDGTTSTPQQIVFALKNPSYQHAVAQAYTHFTDPNVPLDIYTLTAYEGGGLWDVAFNCPYFGAGTPGPGCITIPANKKVWFQIGCVFGGPVTGHAGADGLNAGGVAYSGVDTNVQVWITIDGVTTKFIDYNSTTPEYKPLDLSADTTKGAGGNKFTFSVYQTAKDSTVAHRTYNTWYDELIFSTQRIPDPSSPPTTPTWRQGLAVGQWSAIANTSSLNNILVGTPANRFNPEYVVDVWNGLCATSNSLYGTSSGHGCPHNPVFKIDLSANVPQWVLLDAGTPGLPSWSYTNTTAYANRGRYFFDGRPTTRHVYNSLEVVNNKLHMFGSYATYANDGFIGPFFDTSCYFGMPDTEGFDLTSLQWVQGLPNIPFSRTVNPGQAPQGQAFVVARDPRNDDVYLSLQYRWIRYRNGVYTILRTQYDDNGLLVDNTIPHVDWADYCATIDTKRNRFIAFTLSYPQLADYTPRLDYLNISDNSISNTLVTGDLLTREADDITTVKGSAFIYDPDNDRYIAILRGANSNGVSAPSSVYSINADTGASTWLGNGPTNPTGAYGVYKRAQYLTALGGIAYLPGFASNVYFFPTR